MEIKENFWDLLLNFIGACAILGCILSLLYWVGVLFNN